MVPSTLLAGASWALASLASVSFITVATAPVVMADYSKDIPFSPTPVETEINCFAPMFVYDPADPHATEDKGWYMSSTVIKPGDGEPIYGANVAVASKGGLVSTTMAGASVSVSFWGTQIFFMGDIDPGTKVDVSIDGTTTTTEPVKGISDIFLTTNQLDDGNHTVSITLVSGRLAITSANFTTPIQSREDWRTDEYASNIARTLFEDRNDPMNMSLAYRSHGYFEYDGRWDDVLRIGGQNPNGTENLFYAADYPVVVGYPGSSLKFGYIGSERSAVNWFQVMGVTTVRPASVTVRINPPPPFGPASTTVDVYRLFQTGGDSVVFACGVCDPFLNCTVTITVDEQDADPPTGVAIRGVRIKNTTIRDANNALPSSKPSSTTATISTATAAAAAGAQKKTNVGAIAGGVVGGIGALAIIGALVWFCLRRRRKAAGSSVTPKSPVDLVGPDGPDPAMAHVSPFRISATHQRLETPPYETPMTIGSMGRRQTSYFDTMGRNTSYFDSESEWTETTHTDSNASSGPRSIFSTTTSTRPLHTRNYSSTTGGHFSSANDHETMETVNESSVRGREIEQEYDAGRLVEVVPPTYNPAWAAGDLDAVAPRPGHPGYETPSQPPSQARSPPPIVPLDPDTKIWPRGSRQ